MVAARTPNTILRSGARKSGASEKSPRKSRRKAIDWNAKLRPELEPEIVSDKRLGDRLLLPTPLLVAEEIAQVAARRNDHGLAVARAPGATLRRRSHLPADDRHLREDHRRSGGRGPDAGTQAALAGVATRQRQRHAEHDLAARCTVSSHPPARRGRPPRTQGRRMAGTQPSRSGRLVALWLHDARALTAPLRSDALRLRHGLRRCHCANSLYRSAAGRRRPGRRVARRTFRSGTLDRAEVLL